jgi:GNAT superfamily N-acetyltransferase
MTVSHATPDEFAAILALHAQNHVSNLGEDARGDGFLTIFPDLAHLAKLESQKSLFVARGERGDLAGYVLSAPWNFYAQWPVFATQTDRFPLAFGDQILTTQNSFQYGPVCVAREFRGRGVLPAMFDAVKAHFAPIFPIGATFINLQNARSMAAHRKLGFQIVDEWSAAENHYATLAFSTA